MLLVLIGPVLVQATGAACCIRELGDWRGHRAGRRGAVSVLQIAALALVASPGPPSSLTPDPLRQTLVLGVYGLALTMLFFVFQAPDVALSEIVVSPWGCR